MIVQWRTRAVRDRESLFDFLETRSVQGALHVDARIEHMVDLLSDYPALGQLGPVVGTRIIVVTENVKLAYRIRPTLRVIEILRVIHARQRYPSH